MVSATQTQTVHQHTQQQTQHILKLRSAAPPSSSAMMQNGNGHANIHSSRLEGPLKLNGAFKRRGMNHEDVTPAIGAEFGRGQVDLAELLQMGDSEETDELWRELAALVSHRGVVFFRRQSSLTPQLLTKLASKIGSASGKPSASKLHIHPLSKEFSESGEFVGEKIDSEKDGEGRQISFKSERSNFASAGWHTDISFEPVPSDYAMLQLRTLPKCGGDTLWSSMYSAYDGLSKPMQKFLEGMTAVHDAEEFREQSAKYGFPLYTKERGHPDNVGDKLQTIHPIIRTNPVTGFKGLYINKSFTKRIVELNIDESDALLSYLFRHIAENFNFQVRFRWEQDDLAIWDNRSTQHSGNFDFGKQKRNGDRCCSLGERPYLDAVNSRSREEALAQEQQGGY